MYCSPKAFLLVSLSRHLREGGRARYLRGFVFHHSTKHEPEDLRNVRSHDRETVVCYQLVQKDERVRLGNLTEGRGLGYQVKA
jgi:hypothetical protein